MICRAGGLTQGRHRTIRVFEHETKFEISAEAAKQVHGRHQAAGSAKRRASSRWARGAEGGAAQKVGGKPEQAHAAGAQWRSTTPEGGVRRIACCYRRGRALSSVCHWRPLISSSAWRHAQLCWADRARLNPQQARGPRGAVRQPSRPTTDAGRIVAFGDVSSPRLLAEQRDRGLGTRGIGPSKAPARLEHA